MSSTFSRASATSGVGIGSESEGICSSLASASAAKALAAAATFTTSSIGMSFAAHFCSFLAASLTRSPAIYPEAPLSLCARLCTCVQSRASKASISLGALVSHVRWNVTNALSLSDLIPEKILLMRSRSISTFCLTSRLSSVTSAFTSSPRSAAAHSRQLEPECWNPEPMLVDAIGNGRPRGRLRPSNARCCASRAPTLARTRPAVLLHLGVCILHVRASWVYTCAGPGLAGEVAFAPGDLGQVPTFKGLSSRKHA
mmetsp:Transcript_34728/g.81917  ORF Transcript_34728/g.81917 Transcript_34728/m.81917 type:complete len:256 (+) Transcript_34728:185-952(+)